MKKIFLVAFMAIACTAMMSAKGNQAKEDWNELKSEVKSSAPRAIGANLGTTLGFSYQQGLNNGKGMLDFDVNVPILSGNWGIGAHITYDWINPFNTAIPWNNKGEWNWAMGVGVAGGIYGFKNPSWHAGLAGLIGVAYDFWFPMELSIDWRPEIGVLGAYNSETNKYSLGFGLPGLLGFQIGIRYLF